MILWALRRKLTPAEKSKGDSNKFQVTQTPKADISYWFSIWLIVKIKRKRKISKSFWTKMPENALFSPPMFQHGPKTKIKTIHRSIDIKTTNRKWLHKMMISHIRTHTITTTTLIKTFDLQLIPYWFFNTFFRFPNIRDFGWFFLIFSLIRFTQNLHKMLFR